ncbi:MAG: exosome complex protein Rrp42 [Candidatus Diapherotrites archaeon]|nr:exosome complex protein Rrp42 [Candidatus Diapherotrites archaeon]
MQSDASLELRTDRIREMITQGNRFDSRKLDEYRKIEIIKNISENAEGSARVKLGKTDVVAGVKLIVGTPYPDNPDEGTISIGAEFLPIASPFFEAGPPKIGETELARVVDRGIRESKCIDFKKLCITENEKVWIAFVDIYTINDDGNLFDASSIAALSALLEAKVPKIEDDKIVKGEYTGKLHLARKPLLCTTYKIGGKLVSDPTFVEAQGMDARFSVATTEDNYLTAFQKGGSGSFSPKEIDECIDLSFRHGKAIRNLL